MASVLETNPIANLVLEEGDGISLNNDMLHFASAEVTKAFKAALDKMKVTDEDARSSMVEAIRVERQSALGDLGVVIKPIFVPRGLQGTHTPSLAVFISDPEQSTAPPREVLGQLFGFTPAESDLALFLAKGLSLDEASAALDIRRNTARAHLRSIFAKTGVSRQAMLVRLILNSVAPLGMTV